MLYEVITLGEFASGFGEEAFGPAGEDRARGLVQPRGFLHCELPGLPEGREAGPGLAGELPGVEVDTGEQGLVVE